MSGVVLSINHDLFEFGLAERAADAQTSEQPSLLLLKLGSVLRKHVN
jgi:hypothetical protein